MDTIKFLITEPFETKNPNYNGIDVAVCLNDEELPHGFFNASQVIASSKFHIAEFDLFTCSCGEPGCAGFQEEIKQLKHGNIVKWIFPIANMYKTKQKEYQFNIHQFNDAFLTLQSKLEELEEDNIYHITNFDHIEYSEDEESLEPPTPISEGIQWWENRFKSEEIKHLIISKYIPNHLTTEYSVIYGESISKYTTTPYYLIGSILNQYPTKTNDPFYFNKVAYTANAISEALNGNYKKLNRIITKTYTAEDFSINDFFDRFFYELIEDKEKAPLELSNWKLMVI